MRNRESAKAIISIEDVPRRKADVDKKIARQKLCSTTQETWTFI